MRIRTSACASAARAEVVVADDRRALVTSADFTEAAHERDLEAGVRMDNPAFARRVRRQLDMLVEAQVLRAVSLKGPAADSGLKPDRGSPSARVDLPRLV